MDRRGRRIDPWIMTGLLVAAVQIGTTLTLPDQVWSIPAGMAALALLCAARTFRDAPRGRTASRWRWRAAAIGMTAWGLQWIGNALLNTPFSIGVTPPTLMVAVARAAIVVSLMPLTSVDDRPLLRALDATQGVLFALLLAVLSLPGLVMGSARQPILFFLYLGYGAMALLALTGFLTERSASARRLIVAMLAAQLSYGAISIVTTELFLRGLVTLDMPVLAVADIVFFAYLALIGRPLRSDATRRRFEEVVLPPRLLPVVLVILVVGLAFAMFPAAGPVAAGAALLALVVHGARAWLTEDIFRRHQREVLAAAGARIDTLADLIHEVRSPLGLVSLNAGLIARGAVTGPAVTPLTDAIQERCRAITEMLDDMLDLERIEASMVALDPAPCDLRPVVLAAIDAVTVQARDYGVGVEAPASTAIVTVDARAVSRILANLLDNALRFTPAGGRVWVDIVPRQDGLRQDHLVDLVVGDTGTGLSEESRAQLFSRFCPSGRPQHGRRGSGLGLSISRALARAMDGDLSVRPAPGRGTMMVLTLKGAGRG